MSNEFENQIKEEVLNDKIHNFFKNYRIVIIIIIILIILIPITLQTYLFIDQRKKQKLLTDYLKAEVMIGMKETENTAIKIFKDLSTETNDIISTLSVGKLLAYYLDKNDNKKALDFIKSIEQKYKREILKDIKNIKEVLLNFENIKEKEILSLLKLDNENGNFALLKRKLLFDFYYKNGQLKKANQIKKIQ
jgi:hypothetical protein